VKQKYSLEKPWTSSIPYSLRGPQRELTTVVISRVLTKKVIIYTSVINILQIQLQSLGLLS
jgi:hypothetical protein